MGDHRGRKFALAVVSRRLPEGVAAHPEEMPYFLHRGSQRIASRRPRRQSCSQCCLLRHQVPEVVVARPTVPILGRPTLAGRSGWHVARWLLRLTYAEDRDGAPGQEPASDLPEVRVGVGGAAGREHQERSPTATTSWVSSPIPNRRRTSER
jgi:hypothetical protein